MTLLIVQTFAALAALYYANRTVRESREAGAERRVFQGVTEASAYQTMLRACQTAGVPHYHPRDLRHRRITIWHQSGVPARELAERAGHSRPSMSLDVYSHVMPAGEIAGDRFTALLDA